MTITEALWGGLFLIPGAWMGAFIGVKWSESGDRSALWMPLGHVIGYLIGMALWMTFITEVLR